MYKGSNHYMSWFTHTCCKPLSINSKKLKTFLLHVVGGSGKFYRSIPLSGWIATTYMRLFTGQYDRTIDAKNRIQLPSQLRSAIEPERDGEGLYIILGEFKGTLSIYTERGFEELSTRIETETMTDPDAVRFEMQFFSTSVFVEMDKQGRLVLPDRLRKMARLEEEVLLVGQKRRIDVWNRAEFEQTLGIDWEGEDWPKWQGFLRMKPQ